MTSNKIHILDAPFSETTSINLCDLITVFVFQFFQSIQTTMYYVRINVRKMESLTIGVGQILMRKYGTNAHHQVCIANVALLLFKNSLKNLKKYLCDKCCISLNFTGKFFESPIFIITEQSHFRPMTESTFREKNLQECRLWEV